MPVFLIRVFNLDHDGCKLVDFNISSVNKDELNPKKQFFVLYSCEMSLIRQDFPFGVSSTWISLPCKHSSSHQILKNKVFHETCNLHRMTPTKTLLIWSKHGAQGHPQDFAHGGPQPGGHGKWHKGME